VINPLSWLREAIHLRRSQPDVIILVWWIWVWALPYLTIMTMASRRSRIVLQCHNISDKEPRAWKRWLTNAVLRRAQLLITHSRSETDEAKRRLGEAVAIETLFLPVHELGGSIPSRDEARLKLGIDGDVALFFGHVRPFKGLDIALRAWKLLASKVTLFVAGEVWWNAEAEYRQLAKQLGIEDRVRFEFRFIPDDEVATCFAASDVVVTPYRSEAQSGVAMTSFHFGRPVIASAVGGVPEIIREGENGMLVPPENPEALARAVDHFFTTADRPAMEKAASAGAAKYSWERYGSVVGGLVREPRG
jgi:glycosyltransferase involved in cell wall biosynthesis